MFYNLYSFFFDLNSGNSPTLFEEDSPNFIERYVNQNLQFFFGIALGDCGFIPSLGVPKKMDVPNLWESQVKKNLLDHHKLLFPILKDVQVQINLNKIDEMVQVRMNGIVLKTNKPFHAEFNFSINQYHNQ